MKGEQKLWEILNDKLDTLRVSNRLPEAIRVAESALDLAKRAFVDDPASLAVSYEKLGQLLDHVTPVAIGNLGPATLDDEVHADLHPLRNAGMESTRPADLVFDPTFAC